MERNNTSTASCYLSSSSSSSSSSSMPPTQESVHQFVQELCLLHTSRLALVLSKRRAYHNTFTNKLNEVPTLTDEAITRIFASIFCLRSSPPPTRDPRELRQALLHALTTIQFISAIFVSSLERACDICVDIVSRDVERRNESLGGIVKEVLPAELYEPAARESTRVVNAIRRVLCDAKSSIERAHAVAIGRRNPVEMKTLSQAIVEILMPEVVEVSGVVAGLAGLTL